MKGIRENFDKILFELQSEKELSKIFPSILVFTKRIGDKNFEDWIKLELNGYFDTNSVMTEEIEVPKYRTISGLYYDIYDRPLLLSDPKLSYINETRLRHGVAELEKFSKNNNSIKIVNPNISYLLREYFQVDIHYFRFPGYTIVGLLDKIRTLTIEMMMNHEVKIKDTSRDSKARSKITNLIVQDDLKSALDYLDSMVESGNKYKNELILHRATLNSINKHRRIGSLTQEKIEVKKIKLRAAILELSEKIFNN